ncbi:hypothetical protein ACTFTM_01550 [Micromonospora sp. RB23]
MAERQESPDGGDRGRSAREWIRDVTGLVAALAGLVAAATTLLVTLASR